MPSFLNLIDKLGIMPTDVSDVKKRLKNIEKIEFTKHFEDPKVKVRNISTEELEKNLKNPENLIGIEEQEDRYREGQLCELLFKKSSKYNLVINIKFLSDKNLKVITAHKQNRKRRRLVEKWSKKHL